MTTLSEVAQGDTPSSPRYTDELRPPGTCKATHTQIKQREQQAVPKEGSPPRLIIDIPFHPTPIPTEAITKLLNINFLAVAYLNSHFLMMLFQSVYQSSKNAYLMLSYKHSTLFDLSGPQTRENDSWSLNRSEQLVRQLVRCRCRAEFAVSEMPASERST